MAVTVVPHVRMPKDQNQDCVQILGSMAPNKDGSIVAARIIQLTAGANAVTVLTQATAGAGDPQLLLRPYHIYQLDVAGLAFGAAVTFVQLAFGDTADPVAGDFQVLPGAGAGLQGWLWNINSVPVVQFTALPGQTRLAAKNMGAVAAAIYVGLRELV